MRGQWELWNVVESCLFAVISGDPEAISPADLQTPFNLLAELERPTEQSAFVI